MRGIGSQRRTALIVAVTLALAACGSSEPNQLLDAVLLRDGAAIERLIEAGADVRATESDGTTLLMRAVDSGNAAIAARLIDAGADVSATNGYGVNPLYLAARRSDRAMVALLLAAGADPNSKLPSGETVLMTAAKAGSVTVVELLLAGGPGEVAPRPPSGGTTHGADPNAADDWNRQTALMWAAGDGHTDVVRALLAAGAAVDQRSAGAESNTAGLAYPEIPTGRSTALHFAAGDGHLNAARALVEAGAALNAIDDNGGTPVLLAVLNGHFNTAAYLLDAGADPNVADSYGRTVLFAAVHLRTLDQVQRASAVLPIGATPVDIVRIALAHGAVADVPLTRAPPSYGTPGNSDSVMNVGATPFFRAAMSADLELMQLLLDAGADPLVRTAQRPAPGSGGRPASGGTTAFMAAAGVGWGPPVRLASPSTTIMALELLLARGADVNAANQAGDTALHGAARRGATAIVAWLIEHGADLTARNSSGETPLDVARVARNLGPPNPSAAELLRLLGGA